MFPVANIYSRATRATRDLMCRRMHMMRFRTELLAHIQNTNSQYNLPEIGKNLRYAFNRDGIAARFEHPNTYKRVELDLNLIGLFDQQLSKVKWHIKKYATECDYQCLMLLKSVSGIGHILSLVILYQIHDIKRFPRAQRKGQVSK